MKMTGERLLPVTPQQAWDALNDPAMLEDCIPGCETVTMTEPQRYDDFFLNFEARLRERAGPAAAQGIEGATAVTPDAVAADGAGSGPAAPRAPGADGAGPTDRSRWLAWAVAFAIAVAIMYWLGR